MRLITDKRMTNGFVSSDFSKFLLNQVPATKFTQTEMDELQQTLFEAITKFGGVGISANQLGINKRACLILNTLEEKDKGIEDYLFLVNPVITKKSDEYFVFWETCLSLHKTFKKPIRTYRHTEVVVNTDNFGELTFKVDVQKDKDSNDVSLETLQTSVVQHEIDHLDGITIKDRNSLNWTIKKTQNYGRNDKVLMKSPDGEFVEVKFKKSNEYFLKGYEIV